LAGIAGGLTRPSRLLKHPARHGSSEAWLSFDDRGGGSGMRGFAVTHPSIGAKAPVPLAVHCRPRPSSVIESERISSTGCYTETAGGAAAGGLRMKARRLLEDSSFGPDQVKAMGKALDKAWAQIAPSVDNRPEAIQAARYALADIILSLGAQGNLDPEWLADTAVQLMVTQSSRSQP
jgi:hypothetical protein